MSYIHSDIEIHTLKDGTQIVTAMVTGRPISMTAFEWQIFCADMVEALETYLPKRKTNNVAPDANLPKV